MSTPGVHVTAQLRQHLLRNWHGAIWLALGGDGLAAHAHARHFASTASTGADESYSTRIAQAAVQGAGKRCDHTSPPTHHHAVHVPSTERAFDSVAPSLSARQAWQQNQLRGWRCR